MNAHNEMVAANENDAYGYDTFFNRLRGPCLISVIEMWERMLLVTTIEGSTWEFRMGVRRLNQDDGNHRWYHRVYLTQWEIMRQRVLTLDMLQQLLLSLFGLAIGNHVHPEYIYTSSMKVVSWNCHRASLIDYFRKDFHKYVRIHQPSVVFVLETRVTEDEAWDIVPYLGFSRYEIAPTNDMFGGIWMLWNDFIVDVEIHHTDFEEIFATFRLVNPSRNQRATVYEKPKKTAKILVNDCTIEGNMVVL